MLLSFIDIYNKVMIYKKKNIIKEALIFEGVLIDDLTTFTNQEKKILRSLYKKYNRPNDPEFRWWRLSSYNITEELHEKWELPFNVAYKMAKIFVLHGDELFKKNNITNEVGKSEMLRMYSDRFFDDYRKKLTGDLLDDRWNLSIGGKVHPHEVNFWTSYKGINLYLPLDRDHLYDLDRSIRYEVEDNTAMIKLGFDFEPDVPTLSLDYKIGTGSDTTDGIIIEKATFELPTEINKPEMFVWLDDLLNDQIRTVVEDFKFPARPERPEEEED